MAVYLGSNPVNIFGGQPQGGGGDSELFVFVDGVPYANTNVSAGGNPTDVNLAYSSSDIVAGATITVNTYSDYILDTVTGKTSGNPISFTTVTRGQYTFVMPNESVLCTLYYDD